MTKRKKNPQRGIALDSYLKKERTLKPTPNA
jgi:hypothetical protein